MRGSGSPPTPHLALLCRLAHVALSRSTEGSGGPSWSFCDPSRHSSWRARGTSSVAVWATQHALGRAPPRPPSGRHRSSLTSRVLLEFAARVPPPLRSGFTEHDSQVLVPLLGCTRGHGLSRVLCPLLAAGMLPSPRVARLPGDSGAGEAWGLDGETAHRWEQAWDMPGDFSRKTLNPSPPGGGPCWLSRCPHHAPSPPPRSSAWVSTACPCALKMTRSQPTGQLRPAATGRRTEVMGPAARPRLC